MGGQYETKPPDVNSHISTPHYQMKSKKSKTSCHVALLAAVQPTVIIWETQHHFPSLISCMTIADR